MHLESAHCNKWVPCRRGFSWEKNYPGDEGVAGGDAHFLAKGCSHCVLQANLSHILPFYGTYAFNCYVQEQACKMAWVLLLEPDTQMGLLTYLLIWTM